VGIFFTTPEAIQPAVHESIMSALSFDPKSPGADLVKEAAQRTLKLNKAVAPKFNSGRFIAAVVLGAIFLLLAMYTSKHDMTDISKTLMTCFTSYNGIIVGLLGGEAQKAHSG